MTITTIHGIAGTDLTTLLGTELSDIFIVDEGQIYIEGRDGKDTVEIDSYLERVTIEAGEGSDNIIFSKEIDESIVSLGEGNDTINFQNFTGSINGNEGNDELSMPADTTATNAIIRGNAGKDIFHLENVTKTIINGNREDDIINIDGSTINSQIYAGRHADTINISSSTGSTIRGDANKDLITITGSLTKTIINGNADDDKIIITSPIVSSSSAYGGQGNDDIDVGGGALYINGGKGNDDINASSDAKHSIYGGSGEDSIYSASKNSLLIYGGLDKDLITLSGMTENYSIHTVDGGAANDIINGNRGIEVLDGGSEDNGADTIVSNGGNDTIYGRAGNDLIDLRSGADAGSVLVRAGSGDDVIEVSLNELSYLDNIRGDKGIDTLNVVGSPADFNMWETNTVAEGAFNSIEGVETLAFGSTRSSYTVSGTKTINLSSAAQSAGITKIDASNVTGFGDDVLVINAFQFSSRTNLTFIGSNDKDVNVHFTGGSGNDTLTTGKINQDDSDTLQGGLGEDTFNIIATDNITLIPDLGTGVPIR